jgi:hypothetical protein
MLLSRDEAELVFKLHCALMQFVMDQVRGAGIPASAPAYRSLPAEQRQKVVQAFLVRLDLADAFIAANPARLTEAELEIVSSWRHLLAGRFIALRQLKKYMVLLACDGESTAYGVTGLVDPMERVIPKPLPTMVEMVLLPFWGKIIYDGIISAFKVTFGPGSRGGFEEDFRTAKATKGIVTSLPWEAPRSPAWHRCSKTAADPGPATARGNRAGSPETSCCHDGCVLPNASQRRIPGVVP